MWIPRASRLLRLLLACLLGGRCPGCGTASLHQPCVDCMGELRATAYAPRAALRDEGAAGRLVRLAKHGRWRAGGDVFAEVLVERLGGRHALAQRIDLVTWVPADPGRRRVRGGHLPEQVARGIARRCGLPSRELLVRERSRAQRGLDEHERARNVCGMFRLAGARPSGDAPITLLIDDVCTTGATLDEACRLLELAWYRPVAWAIVGVPRRFAPRAPREPGMDGVEGTQAEVPAENPHGARKFGSGTVVRMPMYRPPRDESEPPFVHAVLRPP
ncbi:MAG: competence protein [Thermoleophilia bacterium]|nr:competence protein [Thermoleophilia bacterium]